MLRRLGSAVAVLFALTVVSCANVEPGAPDATGKLTAAGTATGRYIVKLADREHGLGALQAAGATIVHDLAEHGAVAAHVPEQSLSGLAHNPHIEYVEPDPERYPSAQVTPYGIDMVQASDATFTQPSTAAIKVCIIDSGLYTGHADLAALPVTGFDNPALQWNVDGCGHGTHVAGTIAAVSNDVGVVGVAPNAVALHVVRVFGNDCAWAYASDLVAALSKCRDAGAKVVSMSLGGGSKSRLEQSAFDSAWSAGLLSVAAAGNSGTSQMSYPASYGSVISVAAVDATETKASFSQYNSAVDIAAPGVGVLSTVPWVATDTLAVDGVTYVGGGIEGAPAGNVSGTLVDGGLCGAAVTDGSWTGKVVLCERGTYTFYDKVHNVQLGGGAAAAIYNNVPGGFSGTLSGSVVTIPGITLAQTDGQALVATKLGATGTVYSNIEKPGSGYEAWDGTSMATPHVSGVAALIWSYFPTRTNTQVRAALEKTAKDLGVPGRDTYYGNGLVQAKAAYDYLKAPPAPVCTATGLACTANSQCCSGACKARVCK